MQLLSIVSSFRQDGNTARMADLLEEQLKKEAVQKGMELSIERVSLGKLDIQMCRGCRACFDWGEDKCPLKDDLLSLRDKMLAADGYLVASPVYVEDVNGILKNCIDRLAFLCHRPALLKKSVFLMTTAGMGSSNHALRTMSTAFYAWGCRLAGQAKFSAGALTGKEELKKKHEAAILSAAQAFVWNLSQGDQAAPSLYSLIAFAVQQKYWNKESYQQKSPLDYAYWKSKGWLEQGCNYYLPLKKYAWKAGIARLLARVIVRFVF